MGGEDKVEKDKELREDEDNWKKQVQKIEDHRNERTMKEWICMSANNKK